MEEMQEGQIQSNKKKTIKQKLGTAQPFETLNVGHIEVAIWKGATPSGIPYPQFTLSRSFTAGTGRKGFSRYMVPENEAELAEAVRLGAKRVRELREEMAGAHKRAA